MTYSECKSLITEDFKRLHKKDNILNRLICIISNHSFMITYWFRIGSYLRTKNNILRLLFPLIAIIYKHNQFKTGIQLPFGTRIGGGLLFVHFGCIVVNGSVVIGKNCTIMQDVTIGSVRGKNGYLFIGDNVVLSSGCKVLNSKLGDNVVVGANAVVVKDVANNSVVVGVPARTISYEGPQHVKLYN